MMQRVPRRLAFAASVIGFALAAACGPAGKSKTPAPAYTGTDAMIPMRDGVRLHVKIFTPANQQGPLPFLMTRTPYGVEQSERTLDNSLKALADEGYIFVFEDIRGRYKSEGTFVMQRPARAPGDTASIDEGTDTYDTIDWLLKNVPDNNGRVGMMGVSYSGWTTIMGALEPHPALKAISPQASPADMWLGDDFHHNGAFRLSYGFEYAVRMETDKEQKPFGFDRYDTYDWYLRLGSLANVDSQVPAREDPDVERLRRAPRLRRVLEAPDADPAHHTGDGADAQRRRLVGSGGLLRPHAHLSRRSSSTTSRG